MASESLLLRRDVLAGLAGVGAVLTAGPAAAAPATLPAAAPLSPEHKAVFQHISVFSGGFNLDEAAAIEGASLRDSYPFVSTTRIAEARAEGREAPMRSQFKTYKIITR